MYRMMYIRIMSQKYSVAEARSHLPAILDQAEAGMEIELTRRGKPVAVVLSSQDFQRLRGQRPRFGDAYENFRRNYPIQKIGLEDGFPVVQRDKDPGRKVTL